MHLPHIKPKFLFFLPIMVSIVLCGFAYFYFFYLPSLPTHVTITKDGFSPDHIKIKKGATVIWTNTDSIVHWPASDYHPTHTLYPSDKKGCIGSDLDACRGLTQNETFSYKFEKSGVFSMHDHLSPGLTMVVEVEGSDQVVKESSGSSPFPKSEEFLKLSYTNQLGVIKSHSKTDPKATWEYLKSTLIKDDQVIYPEDVDTLNSIDLYHIFGHIVGNELFRKYSFEGMKTCDRTFAYSCGHGVTEEAIREQGLESLPKLIEVCYKPDSKGNLRDSFGCIHGIGHGLLSNRKLNITQALADCETLKLNNPGDIPACFDGVFMEFAFTAPNSALNSTSAKTFCNQFKDQYKGHCSVYSAFFLRKINTPIPEIASTCQSLPDRLRISCLSGLYSSIAFASKGNFEKIKSQCSEVPSNVDQAIKCQTTAASETRYQQFKGWQEVISSTCKENYPPGEKCPLL